MTNLDIGLLGYGEVGKLFGSELRARAVSWVGAWDIKFADAAAGDADRRHAQTRGVIACETARELCSKAQIIISAVTQAHALEAAQEGARWIGRGATYIDFNGTSPAARKQACIAIEAADAHYVEAGVTTSLQPFGLAVPMLLGGKQALRLADRLRPVGFNITPVSPKIGLVSALTMTHAIMTRGIEALVIESFTTARRHGVEEAMIEALSQSLPGVDWAARATSGFRDAVQQGGRRVEQLHEAARTVKEAGLPPGMAMAALGRHEWVTALAGHGVFDGLGEDTGWQDYADRLLKLKPATSG